MKSINHPIVIVGAGLAGTTTALRMAKFCPHLPILLLSKNKLSECNSNLAQGGIALSARSQNKTAHVEDTLRAGHYENEPRVVSWFVEKTGPAYRQLVKWGVDFENDRALEGGHSERRIYKMADHTGAHIMTALWREMQKHPNIEVWEDTKVSSLVSDAKKCYGLRITRKGYKPALIQAEAVILATGGLGQLVAPATATPETFGEGIGLAIAAGVRTKDLHYLQYHPTALYIPGRKKAFLISEALRGEGAKLTNHAGERFMPNYDDRAELAPRDVVSKAILNEMEKSGQKSVWLDATHLNTETWKQKFPKIYQTLQQNGIDPTQEAIPVFPAVHYLCGGIKTDIKGETSHKNLYAVGECACTGLHGSNRLASNSLSEAVVFGLSTARHLMLKLRNRPVEISKIKVEKVKKPESKVNVSTSPLLIGDKLYHLLAKRGETKKAKQYLAEVKKEKLHLPYLHSEDYYRLVVAENLLKSYIKAQAKVSVVL